MSRNRLRNSQSLHWMGVVKWVLIAGMLSILGLSYMVCKNQNLHLAQETYRLQEQLNQITKRNSQLALDLDTMKSPLRLQRRLAQMHSTLVRLSDMGQMVVRMDQTVHAVVPRPGTVPANSGVDYSSYDDSVASFGNTRPASSPPTP
jgi:hypothetical protein